MLALPFLSGMKKGKVAGFPREAKSSNNLAVISKGKIKCQF